MKRYIDHLLPTGEVLNEASSEDVFDSFIESLKWRKRQLKELIDEEIDSLIVEVKEYKKASSSRGGVNLIRNSDLDPVDVVQASKRQRQPLKLIKPQGRGNSQAKSGKGNSAANGRGA